MKTQRTGGFGLTSSLLAAFASVGILWSCSLTNLVTAAEARVSLEDVRADAAKCVTASDAVMVYKLFLAGENLSDEDRTAAKKDLEEWLEREKRRELRVGSEWLMPEEVSERRIAASDHVKNALELLKLNRVKLAEDELTTASKTDPTGSQSEMILGLIDCILHRDDVAGMRHFQEAARREPTNHLAWNNAAVSGYWAGRTTQLATDFQQALSRADHSDAQAVSDNMGRIIATGRVTSRHMSQLKDLYHRAMRDLNLTPFDAQQLDQETDEDYEKRMATCCLYPSVWEEHFPGERVDGRRGRAADGIVYMGSGTGFVVAKHYVITNHHVISGASEVAVMNPGKRGEFLPAEVIASSAEVDLAVLKCDTLEAPSLSLCVSVPGRGTEIMSLGYPETSVLGLGLKTTRGAVVTAPEPPDNFQFLHSAIVNRGNSGGPLVDQAGAVVGVTVASLKRQFVENTMYVGIPVEEVWRFVRAHATEVVLTEAGERPNIDWPKVDELVSKSTLFIQCKFKAENSR